MSGHPNPTRFSDAVGRARRVRALLADRRGFMLLAAIMLLSISTLMFAMITVSHTRYRLNRSVTRSVETLRGLEAAIRRFHAATGEWPGSLVHLTQAITPNDKNACGQAYNANAAGKWKGPYYTPTITATGVRLGGFGRADAPVLRDPPSNAGGKDAVLQISLIHVRESSVARLDSIFDEEEPRANGSWSSNGLIQWGSTDPQTRFVNKAVYSFPISGC